MPLKLVLQKEISVKALKKTEADSLAVALIES
jgi:hypothetical protein